MSHRTPLSVRLLTHADNMQSEGWYTTANVLAEAAERFERIEATPEGSYPRPWIVGPFEDIWVAADVEIKDGKWHATRSEPRGAIAYSGTWGGSFTSRLVRDRASIRSDPRCI